jgi:hypothetical protein
MMARVLVAFINFPKELIKFLIFLKISMGKNFEGKLGSLIHMGYTKDLSILRSKHGSTFKVIGENYSTTNIYLKSHMHLHLCGI